LEKRGNMAQSQEITDPEGKEVKKSKIKVPEGQMEPMTIKVDPDLKRQIELVADQDGSTPSEFCREILEKSLSGNPNRQRAALLRSLAITREQLSGAAKDEPRGPFKRKPFTSAIAAIEELEDFLKEV